MSPFPPTSQSDLLLVAEFLSFLLRFLAREERQASRRNRGRRRGVQQPLEVRSCTRIYKICSMAHGEKVDFAPEQLTQGLRAGNQDSGAKGCWGKETSMESCTEPIPEAH